MSPIRDAAGAWHRDAPSKAEVLAQSLPSKFHLPPEQFQHNPPLPGVLMNGLCILRTRGVSKELNKLRLNQATGPDKIGAVLLRTLAAALAPPFSALLRRIFLEGEWPTAWRLHLLVPLYKKGSRFDPSNYRGIHLTTILSKVAERVISLQYMSTKKTASEIVVANRRLNPCPTASKASRI